MEVESIFKDLEKLTAGDDNEFSTLIQNILTLKSNDPEQKGDCNYHKISIYLNKIQALAATLAQKLCEDNSILVSVKQQKTLRTSLQIITSLGISMCLLPGVGISLSKRCSNSLLLQPLNFSDEEKYDLLVSCTEFITKIWKVPVFRNIIITLHLSDYLAALIQICYAPLKKPGTYKDFTMSTELYEKLSKNKLKFKDIYDEVVTNCFQPTLMKELLVLQSVTDPPAPLFLKRIVSKELSHRLLVPGGVLSLIRCFVESYSSDSGQDWKRNDMICRIVTAKHGSCSEDDYLSNICSQLSKILDLNDSRFVLIALLCIHSLFDLHPNNASIKGIVQSTFSPFSYKRLITCNLPGTVVLTTKDISRGIFILDVCVNNDIPQKSSTLIIDNSYLLFQMRIKCKEDVTRNKIANVLLRSLQSLSKAKVSELTRDLIFGKNTRGHELLVEEHDAGLIVKLCTDDQEYCKNNALNNFLQLFHKFQDNMLVKNTFEIFLDWFIDVSKKRQNKSKKDLMDLEEVPVVIDKVDEQYASILQILGEISYSEKVLNVLKNDPAVVLDFVEYILVNNKDGDEECVTISLVLLNTVVSNSTTDISKRCSALIPILRIISSDESNLNSILSKDLLSMLIDGSSAKLESECEKAIGDVFNDLLPVRAHGIIQLTKLIGTKDPETLSKKHYIFCLFQQQLKDKDSYIYLSAVNGLGALGVHCTEDVLNELCKEYLEPHENMHTKDKQNTSTETRMKIGDVIVKVTKGLGEMAIVHKSLLLNTILSVCRDEDPLMRASALSSLAELCRVLHYRLGSIIYEVLYLIWETLESDKAVECRRAAVHVIYNLLKGLGKETLVELKEKLLPIYRTLKELYRNDKEDEIVRLHAQIALEELNDIVKQYLFPEVKMEQRIFVLDKPESILK